MLIVNIQKIVVIMNKAEAMREWKGGPNLPKEPK